MWKLLSPALFIPLLAACTGFGADVEGSVDGMDLGGVETVMFGGPFIVLADVPLDCLDMGWVGRHYEQGIAVRSSDFVALQFSWTGSEQVRTGINNVAGQASVASRFLSQKSGAFTFVNGRGGTIEVTDLVEGDMVTGNFDIDFDDGWIEGTFTASYCRNMRE